MKSETRLDSAVFQLTPTRTRCDLIIKANGKSEKIASGLFNPFLAHLKMAQEQNAKGGYSITLEPDPTTDTSWFTKGTMDRFVRFVSTPEVLERVNTVESEILQIEEAIVIQGNDNPHLSTPDEYQSRSAEYVGGSKVISDADAEKAIVLYKPEARVPESNGSTGHEESSKVKLLRVLETRKIVLQKEQGMAFARAAAAGFSMENITHLISFGECFGAARLLDACSKFMELWKRKHETGQWVEIDAADAMSLPSEFSSINASGIMLSADIGKQKEHMDQWLSPTAVDSNRLANGDTGGSTNLDHAKDKRICGDSQVPFGSNEYFHGQYPHPVYPPWPIHSSPGTPVFQPYPMQGMPYYQNYPAGGPYFSPAYPPMEDPKSKSRGRRRSKRHSVDSKISNLESESYEVNTRSQEEEDDGSNASDAEEDVSKEWESHRKGGRSGKKRSGMVVIRNLNYITSNKNGNASVQASESESDGSAEINESSHKKSSRSSRSKGNHSNSTQIVDNHAEEASPEQEVDSGNWQVFQSFLLRDDEEKDNTGIGMYSGEELPRRKWQNKTGTDPIVTPKWEFGDGMSRHTVDFETVDGKTTRIYRRVAVNDEMFHLNGGSRDHNPSVQFEQMESGRGAYKRETSEDLIIYRKDKLMDRNTSYRLAQNEYERAGIMEKGSSYDATDESFIVPIRSGSPELHEDCYRTAVDMHSEYPSMTRERDLKISDQLTHEPDELSLMPERGTERESIAYDPVLNYDAEVQIENDIVIEQGKQEDASGTKEGLKNTREKKLKVFQDRTEKRKMDAPSRKGKPSNFTPSAEAQARASKVRAFKADLQKAKKEKEEEEIRRLEALKRERQKRIASRSSNATQSPSTIRQKSSSHRGSKFSDSEPASSSPLKLHIRTMSFAATASKNITSSKLNIHKQATGNRLSWSVSSLPDASKDVNSVVPSMKIASVSSRRLSDPRGSNLHSSLKRTSSHVSPMQNSDPKGNIKYRGSLQGSVANNQAPKKHSLKEVQKKKVSTVSNLHKSKSAAPLDLKTRVSMNISDMDEKMAAEEEESEQKGNGNKSFTPEEKELMGLKERNPQPQLNKVHDNEVVEKIVVMLENENISAPLIDVPKPEHKTETGNMSPGARRGLKNEFSFDCAAIRATLSPIIAYEDAKNPTQCHLDQQTKPCEVNVEYAKSGLTNTDLDMSCKSYQAPYARAPSLEDPCIRNLNCIKALPNESAGIASLPAETIKVHIPCSADTSVELYNETIEKSRGKEPLRGFKKLLKFGRKSHGATSGPSFEVDSLPMDEQPMDMNSSTEAHMLKNLISQEEVQGGGTPPKASRHFSILSPFRSKATEKKLVT